jgi:hypothetical protein
MTNEVIIAFSIIIIILVSFFTMLILFSYNKQTVENIEYDHYFRMLGDNRNDFLKEVIKRRNIYAFTNWVVPLTSFPILYSNISDGFKGMFIYSIGILIFFFIINILSFVSQRLMFEYVKRVFILEPFVIYILTILSTVMTLLFIFVPMILINSVTSISLQIVLYFITYIAILVALFICSRIVMKKAIHYSVTNVIIHKKKTRIKKNGILYPSLFVRLFSGKDEFNNVIVNKDVISYFRRDKGGYFYTIIMMISTLFYSLFNISTITDGTTNLLDYLLIDTILNYVICFFLVSSLYQMRKHTWFSSEGKNIRMYYRLGYDKYSLFKAKQKVNYILNGVYLIPYIVIPLFFVFSVNIEGIIYILLRAMILILLYTTIINHFLVSDATNPNIHDYDPVAGMGRVNMMMLLGMFSVGILFLALSGNEETSWISEIPYLGYFVMLFVLTILLIIKMKQAISINHFSKIKE